MSKDSPRTSVLRDNDLIQKGQDDLIRRGDAKKTASGLIYNCDYMLDALNAIPAASATQHDFVQPTVKPLVWENFDAWTYWARSIVGTYHVKERNGVWRATLETRAGDELVYEYTTDGLTPGDFEAALLATQADHEARILSALNMQPTASPKQLAVQPDNVAALVEALEFYADWDNWIQDERGVSLVDQDEGKTARTALARVKSKEGFSNEKGVM